MGFSEHIDTLLVHINCVVFKHYWLILHSQILIKRKWCISSLCLFSYKLISKLFAICYLLSTFLFFWSASHRLSMKDLVSAISHCYSILHGHEQYIFLALCVNFHLYGLVYLHAGLHVILYFMSTLCDCRSAVHEPGGLGSCASSQGGWLHRHLDLSAATQL